MKEQVSAYLLSNESLTPVIEILAKYPNAQDRLLLEVLVKFAP